MEEAKAEVKVAVPLNTIKEAKAEVKVAVPINKIKEAKAEVQVAVPINKIKEAKGEVKVAVPLKDFWKAMPGNFLYLVPKMSPDFVKEALLLEGDGEHVGTVFLFKFREAVPNRTYQKEKIVEIDESKHELVLKVLEGGALDHGFSSFMGRFKLSEVAETETLAEITVLYEPEREDTSMPEESVQAGLLYFKYLENHLLNGPA